MSKRCLALAGLLVILYSLVGLATVWLVDPTPGVGHYTTIQAAIDAANPGDEIYVDPGVYNEDLTITKDNLALYGWNAQVHGQAQVAWGLWPLAAPNVDIRADGVIIDGFDFYNPAWVDGFYSSGMIVGGQNVQITWNTFHGPTSDDTDDISQCFQTWNGMDVSGLWLWDNLFVSNGTGAYGYEAIYINAGGTGAVLIEENALQGRLFRGITTVRENVAIFNNVIQTQLDPAFAWAGINVDVANVQVENNEVFGTTGFDVGIDVGQAALALQNLSVIGNVVGPGHNTGIRVRGDLAAGMVEIHGNSIDGNAAGLDASTVTNGDVDATHNWWGAVDGPSGGVADPVTATLAIGAGDSVSTEARFDPWLTSVTESSTWQDVVVAGAVVTHVDPDGILGDIDVSVATGGPGTIGIARIEPPLDAPPLGPAGIYLDIFVEGFPPGAVVTIVYHYTNQEIADLGIDEENLQLFYWDGSAWQGASIVGINTATNTATFQVPASALGGTAIGLGGMGATGDQETDVVDASDAVPSVPINPGDTVLVQTFKIGDPGTIGDTVPDGFDTFVETVTVDNAGTIPNAEVVALSLYRDNGDTVYNPASDTLLSTLGGFSPAGTAVFGIPGLLLTQVADNTTVWYHLVAEFVGGGLTANRTYISRVTGVAFADPLGGRSSALDPAAPLPAWSVRTLYTKQASSGAAETTVEDETNAVFPPAGAINVVLQEVVVRDADATLPGVPPSDGHPTNASRMVVRKAAGTLDPGHIDNLRIYQENGVTPGFQVAQDVLLGGLTVAAPNLVAGEPFDALPAAFLAVADTGNERLYVVGDVAVGAPVGDTLTVNLDIETADGLPGISSQIVTPLPVQALEQLTVGAAVLGDRETDVVDNSTPRTIVPGEVGVVVQTVHIEDAGGGVDAVEDGFPTRIDTMTITGIGNLAANGILSSLALYVEADGIPGWTGGDTQLGATVNNPDLTGAGVEFGALGTLLLEVPDFAERIVYVVAGFKASGGANADLLRTTFNATVYQSAGSSSRFEPNLPGSLPPPVQVAVANQTTMSVVAGDNEADLTDATLAAVIQPGAQKVVIQQFVLEDPGNRGDTVDDTFILQIADITVRLTDASTVAEGDFDWIRLYQETDGNPGFTGGDAQVPGVAWQNPVLDGQITFLPPAPWDQVAERETYYVVADFLPGLPVNGSQLTSTVIVKPVGGALRSGIEDPQPLVASNMITVGQVGALIDILDLTIQPVAGGNLPITVDTGLMADFQVGGTAPYVGRLTITESDQVDVTGVTGAYPYSVVASTVTDPDAPGADITVEFELHLDAGEVPAAGTVLNLGILGTGADGDTCVVDITVVDVFRDQAAAAIPNTVSPGLITLSVTAPQNGDVNCDGALDITDARLVAEHSIGLIDLCTPNPPQWCGECWRGDVAPPYGVLDVTDARWIAEAAIGLRTLGIDTTAGPQSGLSTASIEVSAFAELVVSGANTELADVQGTLYFDPDEVRITSVEGVNGFEVLASWIDNKAGRVMFAAAKLSGGSISNGQVLVFKTNDDLSAAILSLDVLRNGSGQDIPFDLLNSGPAGQLLEFGCSPNPVQDVHTTHFSVKATSPVDEIRVYIYDFSGQLMYDSGWGPNDLAWHLENDAGDVLANGVYYYRMEVLLVGADEPVVTGIGRVAVYR